LNQVPQKILQTAQEFRRESFSGLKDKKKVKFSRGTSHKTAGRSQKREGVCTKKHKVKLGHTMTGSDGKEG